MKNKLYILFLIVWCCSIKISTAQTSQQLDINNINARINTKGFLFNNPYTFKAGFEAPKGSGKHSVFISNLWLGNTTNLAASTYYIDSCDFSNGPLNSLGTTTPTDEAQYNKVWKVTKAEIDYHIGVTTGAIIDPGYVIPSSIATWPAHYYDISFVTNLAPFVDVDTDNTYNPSNGDYPRIKGDMATYIIYNDYSTVPHKLSGGQPIGVEIHQMAYAFGCTSSAALNNTIFVEYKIINKTANTYPNFYFGLWSDIDIGNASNEFVECDVNRSCYFQYNSNGTDVNSGSTLGYGNYHPTQGVVILAGPWIDADGIDNPKTWSGPTSVWSPNGMGFLDGITDNERWGMTGFMHNNTNGLGWQAMPTTTSQYHNVMKSYWVDNSYLRNGGLGHATNYIYDMPSKFVYPGSSDPSRYGTSGWSYPSWDAISAGQAQADEKSIGSMGPVTFGPGHIQIIEAAYVFAQNTTTTGVQPGKDLFFQYVDEIKNLYTNNNLGCNTTNIKQIKNEHEVTFYPNPINDKLYISGLIDVKIKDIQLFSVTGKFIQELNPKETVFDLSQFATGVYFIHVQTDNGKIIRKLIKN